MIFASATASHRRFNASPLPSGIAFNQHGDRAVSRLSGFDTDIVLAVSGAAGAASLPDRAAPRYWWQSEYL